MSWKENKDKLKKKKIKKIYNKTDHLHYQVEMRTWEKAHEWFKPENTTKNKRKKRKKRKRKSITANFLLQSLQGFKFNFKHERLQQDKPNHKDTHKQLM